MRKDNLIDKPIAVSLFGTVASATLMVAFAIAYRITGLFVPDTNAVMVAVHGIISLCGNILMFFTIATVASVIYSKLRDDRAIAERFAKPPKSSAVSSVLTRIAFAAIMICAVGFVIEVVGMSPLTPPTISIVGFLGGAARFIAKPCLKQRVMRFPTIRYGCSI